jgi:hypothetical protein
VDRNLALRQQSLKGELAHFRKPTRLSKCKPLLLKKCQSELLLQFGLSDMSRSEHLVRNCDYLPQLLVKSLRITVAYPITH